MTHADHRRRQQRILDTVIELCRADQQVVGLVARGSYSRGATDAFSDLDLACYLSDDDRTTASGLHQRVSRLAPALSALYLYDGCGLYLYDNGVRLDLTYKARSAVRTDSADALILYDRHHILATELGAAYHAELARPLKHFNEGDPEYVTWFLWMFRQIYAWTKRGAQGGERAYDKLAAAADSVHQVRTSLAEMRLWTLGADDPDLAQLLADTYPHLLPDELLASVKKLLAAYEWICPAYCRKAGILYSNQSVAALRRILDEFDQLQ